MLAEERRNIILKKINEEGTVQITSLAEELNVSIETVRRDFLLMESEGQINRVHGGAVARTSMATRHKLSERNKENEKEKRALAKVAATLVEEGDIIGIDAGSTALVFAEVLKERFESLTVVTYSLDVFLALEECKGYNVILCSGNYDDAERCFMGALTLDALSRISVQKAFIFPSAVSIKQGVGYFCENSAMVVKALGERAEQVYILADSTKYERIALIQAFDFRKDFIYVCDTALPSGYAKLYREAGVNFIAAQDYEE